MTTTTRPPVAVRLRYRLGVRVPPEWVSWVEEDLSKPGWLRRQLLGQLVLIVVLLGVVQAAVAAVVGDLSLADLSIAAGLFVAWVVEYVYAARLERTRVFAGNRRLILAYHRGGTGDFWQPSKGTIPWMVAGLVIALVIVLVVRALT